MNWRAKSLVYFIRPIGLHGPVKIGCSLFPPGRLETLMSWSPVPLEIAATVPGSFELERRIQAKFGASHSHREWFFPSSELTDFIAALAAGRPVGELIDLSAPIGTFRKINKVVKTPARTMYLSYAAKVRWAERKLRTESARYSPPERVEKIIKTWLRNFEAIPSAEELALLDSFIANPAATAVEHPIHLRVVHGGAA